MKDAFYKFADYFDWRTDWREEYKALSEKIRTKKQTIRTTMQSGGWAGLLQCQLIYDKKDATELLAGRQFAKEEAMKLWLLEAKEKTL